jgi:hypothetical protein
MPEEIFEKHERQIGELTSRVAYLEYQRSADLTHMANTDRRLNRIERSLGKASLLLPPKEDEKLQAPRQRPPTKDEQDALFSLFRQGDTNE